MSSETSQHARSPKRQYTIAVAIGLAGGILTFLLSLLTFAIYDLFSSGRVSWLVAILTLFVLYILIAHIAGQVLARYIPRESAVDKIFLATPFLYYLGVPLLVAIFTGDVIDDLDSEALGPLLMTLTVIVISFGLTASGFYRSHGRVYPADAGVCCKCGYNLTGNVSGRCPECGTDIVAEEEEPGSQEPDLPEHLLRHGLKRTSRR